MKKKFLSIVSLLVAIVMSLALAACHGGVPPTDNPDNPDNPEKPNEPAPEKKKKCGAVAGASVSVVSALICLLGASAFIAARGAKKNRA